MTEDMGKAHKLGRDLTPEEQEMQEWYEDNYPFVMPPKEDDNGSNPELPPPYPEDES